MKKTTDQLLRTSSLPATFTAAPEQIIVDPTVRLNLQAQILLRK